MNILEPYLLYIKLFLVAAVLGCAGYGGYRVGVERTTQKWDADKAQFAKERADWALEKAALNAEAATKLETAVTQAQKKQVEQQRKFDAATKVYDAKIKELQDEKNRTLVLVDDLSPDGGLWIDATDCTGGQDSVGKGDLYTLSRSGGSATGAPATVRCRLPHSVAAALVEIASTADTRTALLNQCIADLNAQHDQAAGDQKQDAPSGAGNP